MTGSITHAPARTTNRVATRGRWCVAAGIVGVLQGLTLLVWPAQVSDQRFSYPLSAPMHVIAQATFFLQHVVLVLAVAALLTVVTAKVARYGLVAASVGLTLLAAMEVVAMSGATTDTDSSLASALYAGYGPPVLLAGIGLIVAGVALVRRPEVGMRTAWILVALGAWVFVGLTPALSSNSFVAGRVAIIVWMLGFVGLGWAMTTQSSSTEAKE